MFNRVNKLFKTFYYINQLWFANRRYIDTTELLVLQTMLSKIQEMIEEIKIYMVDINARRDSGELKPIEGLEASNRS